MKRNILFLALAVAGAMGLSACHGGNDIASVNQAWYNVYGDYCGNQLGPGCDFYSDGTKLDYAHSPLYADLEYGTYYYTDVYGYSQSFTGWARMTNDGLIYDENGTALNSVTARGRDTITNAAAEEQTHVRGAAKSLEAKYGLSNDVAMNIATSLNDWALIGKTRTRTQADVAAFAKRVSGVDIGEINAALEAASSGDNSALDQTVQKVARNWSTNPDVMKQILANWFKGQN